MAIRHNSDRLNEYVRQATQLDRDQISVLGDPVSKQTLSKEITHTVEYDMSSKPRRQARRRRPQLATASGIAVVALVGGIVVIVGVGQPQTRPPVASSSMQPTSVPPRDDRQGDVFPEHAASCVAEYDAATLAQRSFAFDGTVTSIGASPVDDPAWPSDGGPNPYHPVTFTVNH